MQGNISPRFIFTPFALVSGQIYCWAISHVLNFIFLTQLYLGEFKTGRKHFQV